MGNPYGCTLKFKTREQLDKAIQDYFDTCDKHTTKAYTKDGIEYEIKDPLPYTMSGLAVYLGVNRTTLLNYGEREEYSDLIHLAKSRVEMCQELMLQRGNDRGAAFSLKNNFNWSDKTELEIGGALNVQNSIDFSGTDSTAICNAFIQMLDNPGSELEIIAQTEPDNNDDNPE